MTRKEDERVLSQSCISRFPSGGVMERIANADGILSGIPQHAARCENLSDKSFCAAILPRNIRPAVD